MKKKLLLTAMFFIAFHAFSQNLFTPVQMNVKGEKENPITLTSLSIDAQIMGNIATTKVDMIFYNDTNRVLEGELIIPLGDGETVTGYALDINGKLRDGVVVEKNKGRQVFEAVVREGIDPGLIEKTAGNNFKTRVYPIPAKGNRRVQVTIQSEVNESYVYSALPAGQLQNFDFRITVLSSEKKSVSTELDLQNLDFSSLQGGMTTQFSKKNIVLTKPLKISLPEQKNSDSIFTQDIGRDTFFYYNTKIKASPEKKDLPHKLTVWWDVSSSAENRDIEAELELLKNYLSKIQTQDISGGNVTVIPEVTVIPFSNSLQPSKVFKIVSPKEFINLAKFIRSLNYDGASNLCYDFTAGGGDEILIFTDGIQNWKTPGLEADSSYKNPVSIYTVNSSLTADLEWLNSTAQKNGGCYINLCTMKKDAALKALLENPLRLVKAEYDRSEIPELYPGEGTIVNENFSVSGLLKKKEGSVTLYFGHGKKAETSVTFTPSAVTGIQSENAARQFASKKIDFLNMNYRNSKDEIIAVAKKFKIVTKDTSLIVLDNVQDYIRYGIVPPESDTELYREYSRLISSQNDAKIPEEGIPSRVYETFESFRKWWNTDISEFKKLKKKNEKSYADGGPLLRLSGSRAASSDDVTFDEEYDIEENVEEYSLQANESPMVLTEALDASPRSLEKKAENSGDSKEASIKLQGWNPASEYLAELKKTERSKMYGRYLELKKQYHDSPSFYMEVSDYFMEEDLTSESMCILSNLAELNLQNTDLLRSLANKLVERKAYPLAVFILEELVELKGEIPQFHRDLGMAYHLNGENQKAIETLYSVASGKWDFRFQDVQQIALNDMNAIIAQCRRKNIALKTDFIDPALIQNFDMDVRIILTWNFDDCDVDLWVTDKDNEKCYYGNKLTRNGGRMSPDFTRGYGPEEFCIRHSPGGTFRIQANYYASHQQTLLQPVVIQAEVYTNFGRPDQKRQVLTLQLEDVKDTYLIGEITY